MNTYNEMIADMQNFLMEEPSEDFSVRNDSVCWDFELRKWGELAQEFDQTGRLALVYLSILCRRQIDDTIAPLGKILKDSAIIDKYRRCLQHVNSPEVAACRAEMVNNIAATINGMTSGRLIGGTEAIDAELDDAVDSIFHEFSHLKFESYMKSGLAIGNLNTTSISVQVCSSLAECLLRLEKSPDGIYVGYISNPGTLDGWFGFFVKSNGNMFSYNERIDEAYVGQHRNMRNGRYAEGKAYDLFPYELCKFSEERDYKGYAKEINIGDKVKFVGEDAASLNMAVRMILSFALIAQKHLGHTIEGETVIVDSLLSQNLARLENGDTEQTALVKWNGSELAKVNGEFKIPEFDLPKVLRGDYDKEFNGYDGSAHGVFWGVNQDIVDAYKDGFQIDRGKLLVSNSSRRLIGDGSTEQEFIGTEHRLRLRAYYEIREQLADHLIKRMREDFNAFGGKEALSEWYIARLRERIDKVLRYCAEAYDSLKDGFGRKSFGCTDKQPGPEGDPFINNGKALEVTVSTKPLYAKLSLSEFKDGSFLCYVAGTKAHASFRFEFINYVQVQNFLECDLPKFCVGWWRNRLYNGNSILNVTDPVGEIYNRLDGFQFDFVIGLGKRAINNLKKEGGDE